MGFFHALVEDVNHWNHVVVLKSNVLEGSPSALRNIAIKKPDRQLIPIGLNQSAIKASDALWLSNKVAS